MMRLPREFILFSTVGGIATGAHMLCLVGLVELLAVPALAASCAGALVGALISYWLNYHITFRSTAAHRVALPRFLFIAVVAFVANGTLMAGLLRFGGLHYLVAQVITTAAVLALTFSAGRLWAFR